ncbi:TPA: hypothetical protein ROG05_004062 [Enterobacter soli]|nr:hypothetical protein [Enterobacter soli]
MLFVDQCRYTLLGIEQEQQNSVGHIVESTYPSGMSELNKLVCNKKYDFIIISFACFILLNTSRMINEIISRNSTIKVIVLSAMNWPDAKKPLKLSDNIYLAGRGDLPAMFKLYREGLLEKYLLAGSRFLCSPQEEKVLNMMVCENKTSVICEQLKINRKTISSHLGNVKRKISARSNQQILHAYIIKHVFLNL